MDPKHLSLPGETLFPEIASWLAEGHSVTLQAKGNSMLPFIAGGRDRIVLEKAGSIRKGDIVLAHLPEGGWVLHRVYGRKGGTVTLMGDGNVTATETCREQDIHGRVSAILHASGRRRVCSAPAERLRWHIWAGLLPLRRGLLFLRKMYHT